MAYLTAHQYELAKLFKTYDMLYNPYRMWSIKSRPIPSNVKSVTSYEKGKYDFALLHIDQQCFNDRFSKGRLYFEVNNLIKDIPKVVINHMTPFDDKLQTSEVILKCREWVGDNVMVVNSYEAASQWGFGTPIIHGLDPDEWWDLPKEPRAITVLSPAGMNTAYRREFLRAMSRILKEDFGIKFYWVGVDTPTFDSFDTYRNYLGRSLIFVNGTWQSPRPRARTEAMMSGCAVVTMRYHDVESFIQDGKNGYLIGSDRLDNPSTMENPRVTAKFIAELLTNRYEEAVKVGQEGKKTAQKLFNTTVWRNQWETFLKHKVGVL